MVVKRKRSRGEINNTLQLASERIKTARPCCLPTRLKIASEIYALYNDAKIDFYSDHLILVISRGIIQRLRYATMK